jgi:predicted RNA-binding protein with PUA-like domain
MVDVKALGAVPRPVALSEIKKRPELSQMPVVRIGRLSVSPVTAAEWAVICAMGEVPDSLAK